MMCAPTKSQGLQSDSVLDFWELIVVYGYQQMGTVQYKETNKNKAVCMVHSI